MTSENLVCLLKVYSVFVEFVCFILLIEYLTDMRITLFVLCLWEKFEA